MARSRWRCAYLFFSRIATRSRCAELIPAGRISRSVTSSLLGESPGSRASLPRLSASFSSRPPFGGCFGLPSRSPLAYGSNSPYSPRDAAACSHARRSRASLCANLLRFRSAARVAAKSLRARRRLCDASRRPPGETPRTPGERFRALRHPSPSLAAFAATATYPALASCNPARRVSALLQLAHAALPSLGARGVLGVGARQARLRGGALALVQLPRVRNRRSEPRGFRAALRQLLLHVFELRLVRLLFPASSRAPRTTPTRCRRATPRTRRRATSYPCLARGARDALRRLRLGARDRALAVAGGVLGDRHRLLQPRRELDARALCCRFLSRLRSSCFL